MSGINGQVLTLKAHGFTAEIATLGATLVSLEYQGRPLVRAFDPLGERPAYSGAILAPWPNRVTDGNYRWDGVQYQLPLSEPARGHALHGLVTDDLFTPGEHADQSLELRTTISPSEGYPFEIQLAITYQLEAQGLRITAAVTNNGSQAAPFGWGSHAYLVAPGKNVNGWNLSLPAQRVQLIEGERLLPKDVVSVDSTELDFRSARVVGDTFIDHAYTGLDAGEDQLIRAVLTDENGIGSQVIWDETQPWVQIHTADRDDPELNRTGLAIEPMTCPPGAFNSGEDVIRLEPGSSHQTSWVIAPA
ncbi:aldose 1-epimerase family protein [Glutamicibacter sp. JC586]|uniref:aldose 1-epimerase family protein n=1 Tax=Glutamicibacter sp. JC586 TaxID=2590552 RepID=UPI00135C979C|nr:aldose 1-epimerase family protein [Glutamicibacter sp. JC586]